VLGLFRKESFIPSLWDAKGSFSKEGVHVELRLRLRGREMILRPREKGGEGKGKDGGSTGKVRVSSNWASSAGGGWWGAGGGGGGGVARKKNVDTSSAQSEKSE